MSGELGVPFEAALSGAAQQFTAEESGAVWAERPYTTKSFAKEGVGSAMKARQAQAICASMFDTVGSANGVVAKK